MHSGFVSVPGFLNCIFFCTTLCFPTVTPDMDAATPLKKTPLHDKHVALGARMMGFAGYDMPVQYTGIIDEHMAVRNAAGVFDVSHMGEVLVRGPQAFAFVQNLVSNNIERLYDGRALYTVMCTPEGGIIDDLLVYRLNEESYLLVINASNIEKDWAWMQQQNTVGAHLENISDNVALLAVQGPKAVDVVQALTDINVSGIKYYHFAPLASGSFFGCNFAILSHTGYTGESGFEIYCDADKADAVWDAVLEAGASVGLKPAGLGARDTLRVEAGYCLYGNDITNATNPLEAGLGWVTKLDKGEFVGREALQAVKAAGTHRKLVGFILEDRGVPRAGYPLLSADGSVEIGQVTSGTQSPILSKGVGLGYVSNDPAYTKPGQTILVQVRKRHLKATVTKPPFHKA